MATTEGQSPSSPSSGGSHFPVTVVLCRGPHISISAHWDYRAFASQMACTCMTNLMYSRHTVHVQQPFVLDFWVSGSLVQLLPQLACLPSANTLTHSQTLFLLFPNPLLLPCPPLLVSCALRKLWRGELFNSRTWSARDLGTHRSQARLPKQLHAPFPEGTAVLKAGQTYFCTTA